LLDQLAQGTEATLWQAVKSLQESTALLAETAASLRQSGERGTAQQLETQVRAIEDRLAHLRSMALDRAGLTGTA
jgi:hypothetical protein